MTCELKHKKLCRKFETVSLKAVYSVGFRAATKSVVGKNEYISDLTMRFLVSYFFRNHLSADQ